MNIKINWKSPLVAVGVAALVLPWVAGRYAAGDTGKVYVGSEACKDCHETEFRNFLTYAKKASSFKSVELMKKGLTESELKGCFKCHTTGYGEPGGFVSEKETPHLKNAGCEVCHGPGSVHCETEDAEDIKAEVSIDNCQGCHSSERIDSFNFRPLVHGGAH